MTAVPLMSQWRYFGQQALCVPLPHKQSDSIESRYAHWMLVLLSCVLCTLCSVCEMVTRMSDRTVKLCIKNNAPCWKDFQFVVLGSLASGLLYAVACLVPTDSHTDRQKATHTALVYFGPVISSGVNPFLHLYGVRVARNKRLKQERLLIISRAMPDAIRDK